MQHIALHCNDVVYTVRKLQRNGLDFLRVPDSYYDCCRRGSDRWRNRLRRFGRWAFWWTATKKAICCKSFPNLWKIGRRCSSRLSSARAAAASGKEISRHCLNRSNWSRRGEEICRRWPRRDELRSKHSNVQSQRMASTKNENPGEAQLALPIRIRQRVCQRGRRRHAAPRQNAPQKVAHGFYAEQLSGTPFTAPRGLIAGLGSIAFALRWRISRLSRSLMDCCAARRSTRCRRRQISCAGSQCRFPLPHSPPISSTAGSPWRAMATPILCGRGDPHLRG